MAKELPIVVGPGSPNPGPKTTEPPAEPSATASEPPAKKPADSKPADRVATSVEEKDISVEEKSFQSDLLAKNLFPSDDDKPFTVRRGDTVQDVASLVHKDIAEGLRFASMWGADVYDGQQVGPDHLVVDGDLVEMHV